MVPPKTPGNWGRSVPTPACPSPPPERRLRAAGARDRGALLRRLADQGVLRPAPAEEASRYYGWPEAFALTATEFLDFVFDG